MAQPIVPDTQATGDVDTNTNPPVVPLFISQETNINRTVSGTTTSFGQLEPEPLPDAGVFDTVEGRTTLFDPGTGPAEGTLQTFGDSEPFVPIGVPVPGPDEPGAGSSDDNPGDDAASTQAQVNDEQQTDRIEPQPNVLSRFSSYTYSASVYLLNPQQFDVYQKQAKKNVNGYHLLFQSGGAPPNVQGPQASTQRAAQTNSNGAISGGQIEPAVIQPDGRNPYFADDFYINTITIESQLPGRATGSAHSVSELKFTVCEPNNITLIDRLYLAVKNSAPRDAANTVNYGAAVYLMVIRFYGYDANGNRQIVGAADPETGLTDPNAVVEKFIPFFIKRINWEVGNNLVTYEWDCSPIGQLIAGGTRRGTIPADVELSGTTVENLLKGEVAYSTAQAAADAPGSTTTATRTNPAANGASGGAQPVNTPPAPAAANAAPTPRQAIRQGLITAMNELQQQYLREGKISQVDQYVLEFANGAESIAAATVVKPGRKVNKSATATPRGTQDTQVLSPDKQNMDVTSRNEPITAGMQLLQAIDRIIRNSNYITDQADQVRTESTGKTEPNPKRPGRKFYWYNILTTVTPLQFDPLRNDYAYRVKYTVVPYRVTDFLSVYFDKPPFLGVHKRYPWWFTGLNTEVLDYRASFNNLYNITVTSGNLAGNGLQAFREKFSTSGVVIPFLQVQARSTESQQGAEGGANELAASAAEYLYSPSDNANVSLKILGDPAWIPQGSVTGAVDDGSIGYRPFNPDGSINFDVSDVLFEIVWQRPEDYDLQTGLADPYSRTSRQFGTRQPLQSVIYRATKSKCEFRRGSFETVVEGTLYQYEVPDRLAAAASGRSAAAAASGRSAQADDRQDPAATSAAVLQSAVASNNGTGPSLEPEPPAAQTGADDAPEVQNADADTVLPADPAEPPDSNGDIEPGRTTFVGEAPPPTRETAFNEAGAEIGTTTFFGESEPFVPAGIPIENGNGTLISFGTSGRLRPEDLSDQVYVSLNSPQQLNKDM